MARKSRVNVQTVTVEQAKQKIYNCGVYRRLSVEDGDDEEFNSIGNQLKIAEDYVLHTPFLHITKVYEDNGISGMTYKRPGFQEMMEDLYAGVIDTVIVKDVSRLGRHFVLTSELVEKTFPSMEVRLICINDNYDSLNPDADVARLLLPLKMLMNDNYAKDFSKKIRSSINVKMDNGEFLPSSGSIPYGYIRNPKENTFDIDEETAPVVRRIYDMREDGMSFSAIAKVLNDDDIPSPGRIRFDRGLTKCAKFENAIWVRGAIRKILSDPVYIGSRIHGKVKRDKLGEDKTRRDKNEWHIIEDAHKAIISKDKYDRVQLINEDALEKRANFDKKPDVENDQRELLKDKVYCGDCGNKMTGRKGIGRVSKFTPNPTYVYFDCNRYMDSAKQQCKSHYIRQEDIISAIEKCLKEHLRIVLDYEQFLIKVKNMPKVRVYQNAALSELASAKARKTNLGARKEKLLTDFMEGILDKQEYDFMRERLDLQLMQVEHDYMNAKRASEELMQISNSSKKWIDMLKDKRLYEEQMEKSLLDALVDKVYIYDRTHIHIVLKFKNPFEILNEFVEKVEKEVLKDAG